MIETTKQPEPSSAVAKRHSLDRFVGRSGTFTDFNGRVFACVVTGHDDMVLLKISYVRDGELITDAYIDRDNFEDDSSNVV